MITHEMVRKGIHQGIVRFIIDPNMEDGTVCAIGDNWFYFGGLLAEETKPENYLEKAGIDKAVNDIYDAVTEIKDTDQDEYDYYLSYLQENISAFQEAKCDYMDDTDMFWRVDAWTSGDPNEEGQVVAFIDDLTGRAVYAQPGVRFDPKITALVKKKQEEITTKKVTVGIGRDKLPFLQVKTPLGILTADPETEEDTGRDSIYTGIKMDSGYIDYLDLNAARVGKDDGKNKIMLYEWSDVFDEDWQHKTTITAEEIDELIEWQKKGDSTT